MTTASFVFGDSWVSLAKRLIKQLEEQQFIPAEGRDDADRAYRVGWNDRSRELVRQLRVEAGLDELRTAPTVVRVHAWDLSDAEPYGGEA